MYIFFFNLKMCAALPSFVGCPKYFIYCLLVNLALTINLLIVTDKLMVKCTHFVLVYHFTVSRFYNTNNFIIRISDKCVLKYFTADIVCLKSSIYKVFTRIVITFFSGSFFKAGRLCINLRGHNE